ncbi:PadR family transcriptional regulator [Nafulsella turpanensis]|uniref:PadR family transcriptional regulator n=1 Tax=Nafulsella turpanensis TaxID=1265690 RepID=UPI000476E76E|nr:PadR family transcriptional regulator [Nafulsella turpanensis]
MNKQLIKGSLSTIVLKLVGREGRMYGYEITQRVRQLTDGQIRLTEGALYPTLHKLEAEGYLNTKTEIVEGRARKYYYLTEEGEAITAQKVSETAAFIQHLQKLLNLNTL